MKKVWFILLVMVVGFCMGCSSNTQNADFDVNENVGMPFERSILIKSTDRIIMSDDSIQLTTAIMDESEREELVKILKEKNSVTEEISQEEMGSSNLFIDILSENVGQHYSVGKNYIGYTVRTLDDDNIMICSLNLKSDPETLDKLEKLMTDSSQKKTNQLLDKKK